MLRVPAVILGALAAIPMLLSIATRAEAHAVLEESSPRDGAVIGSSPDSVSITVTERPDPALSSITVVDVDGQDRVEGELRVSRDGSELRTGVSSLPKGVYTVSWRVFSTVDGHITGGVFAFGIQVSPDEVTPQDLDEPTAGGATPLETTARALFYVGVIAIIGSAWVAAFVLTDDVGSLRRTVWAATAASAAGSVLLGVAQAQKAGADLSSFLATSIGRAVLWRVGALVLVLPAVFMLSAPGHRRRVVGLLALTGGVAAIVANSTAGHAAAPPTAWLKITVQTVHLSAVSVWIGGLAALVIGLRRTPSTSVAVSRFSRVAGVAIFVVLGAGTFRAFNEVSRWSELFTTSYGRIVLAKVTLFALIGVAAMLNRYRNLASVATTTAPLVRWSKIELSLAAIVLVLTGMLASLVPARVAATDGDSSGVQATGQDFAGTVRAELEVSPGTSGANRFAVRLVDPSTDEPVEAQGVALRLLPPAAEEAEASTLELHERDGGWEARGNGLFIPGVWKAVVLVRSGTDSVEIELTVPTRCETAATPVDNQPTLYDVETGGGTAQSYIDPGKGGRNEVHFTYFDESGTELDLADEVAVTALSLDTDESESLDARRLSSGHFVARSDIEPGRWRFDASAVTERDVRVRACFEEEIE